MTAYDYNHGTSLPNMDDGNRWQPYNASQTQGSQPYNASQDSQSQATQPYNPSQSPATQPYNSQPQATQPYNATQQQSTQPYGLSQAQATQIAQAYSGAQPQVPQLSLGNQSSETQSVSGEKTNLIINYLPQSMTDENFRKLFSAIGPLKNSKVCRNKQTGWSFGYGFVDYFTQEHAQAAIDKLNGHQIENKRLKVAFSRPGAENNKGSNLYVRNLPQLISENQLRKHFEKFGSIVNCRVLLDKATGLCNGNGFILFEKKGEAQAAIDGMNGQVIEGGKDPLAIRYADDNSTKVRAPIKSFVPGMFNTPQYPSPGPIRPPMNRFQARFNPLGTPNVQHSKAVESGGFTLYVYNVGFHPNEQNLAALFSQFGVVNKVDIIWDWQKNQSKGFAFISMATREAAQMAIDNLNGYMFANRPLQVSFYAGKKM